MPIPVWVLLGFAGWTLLLLFSTVGVYRWSRLLGFEPNSKSDSLPPKGWRDEAWEICFG